ncbi:MAG TPA: IS66 family transposase [Vulgatibacter sp.]|nr:IS66 family transposase [Vulgatibacter sp.]
MAPSSSTDHQCEWRDYAKELEDRLLHVQAQVEALQRHVFGKRSEKMPPIAKELRASGSSGVDPAATQEKRRKRADERKELPTREIPHKVPEAERCCPKCGGEDLRPLGDGKQSVIYEYIPPRFERQVHVQEILACRCGDYVVTAPGPVKVIEKGGYGPGLIAHLITAKCADSIPLHRLAKALERAGITIARSTLVDLFHRAAGELQPLFRLLLEEIAAQDVVHADETTQRVQAPGKTRTAFLWTFLSVLDDPLIAFCFSPSRSGSTPKQILGGTKGALIVDAYTGYHVVTTPEGRDRVGCWAHARRKFFDARTQSPVAQEALDLIIELYRVEADARAKGVLRTAAHRQLRGERSRAITDKLHAWLKEQQPQHLPKGPLGIAIRYALGQWEALTRFLDDARLPLDNNAAEGALRVAALGRKNFLFVGHDTAGENLAGLYSLVATCEANGINPEEYLADVLIRVKTHPNSRIRELLPPQWKRLRDAAPPSDADPAATSA